jgi:transcriptional regulator with XRE-family HTH domain
MPSTPKNRDSRIRDSQRLEKALASLGISQSDAARRAGIDQRHIAAIIAGDRPLGREVLRKLGKAGVSADYVLGSSREHVSPSTTRVPAALELDVAEVVQQYLAGRFPLEEHATTHKWQVDGSKALESIKRTAAKEAKDEAASLRRFANVLRSVHALGTAATRLNSLAQTLPSGRDEIEKIGDAVELRMVEILSEVDDEVIRSERGGIVRLANRD